MKIFTLIYILNASLLLMHEIESAYVKEWEILRLPGGITGFLLLHIPIVSVLFWGAAIIEKQTTTVAIIALIAGAGGLIPIIIHKIIVKRKGYFESLISNIIIISNAITGILTAIIAMSMLAGK